MSVIRITISCRTFDVLYDFKKDNGTSFWDAFLGALKKENSELIYEQKGSMNNIVYMPTDLETDVWESRVRLILENLLGREREQEFVLSVKPLSDDEINYLRQSGIENASNKSWLNGGSVPSVEPASVSTETKETAAPEAVVAEAVGAASSQGGSGGNKPNDEKDDENKSDIPDSLASEAAKIGGLKEALVKVVRGQRHAIDEVVQTVFECDTFSSQNEKRKGPLATFLFTGPSGVGKTFLAKQLGDLLGRKTLTIDMSEYSDNLSHGKFNGEFNSPALVTGFVRQNPRSIIIFDEIEKAHINTIHLFLQILDEGRLTDMKLNREISFREAIVIITTNAGASLYEDTTVTNLSNVSRKVILEALKTDINPSTQEPYFPECIVTRMANGHVLLFNHLEPYALMEIVRDEIALQVSLFKKTFNVDVEYDPTRLSALILYSAGGVSDARTLRGIAKNTIVKELQESIMQTYIKYGENVNKLKTIKLEIDVENAISEIKNLFKSRNDTRILVFADKMINDHIASTEVSRVSFDYSSDISECKRKARGIVDYILIDPYCGMQEMKRTPNDIEDIKSDGMDLFDYMLDYYPEVPIYLMDTREHGESAFETLLSRGARGVFEFSIEKPDEFKESISVISVSALINNSVFLLGRSGKVLTYNCAQYDIDEETAVIAFEKFVLKLAPSADDKGMIARKDINSGVTFEDIVGCKAAKQALSEYCLSQEKARERIAQGKRMPKGILLYGPPGTGKTMLAKAMANESDVAFIPTTATSFFGSLVGESERNIRELFRRARKYAPSIIFVDEVDAIGRMRTGSVSSVHNEDALNAFIAEMDGFSSDERRPVYIVAATNYDIAGDSGRVLDPAFVRRFDKKIFVDLPDTDDRYEFLKKALKKHGIDLGEDHDKILKNMAQRSSGSSPADLEIIVDMFLRNIGEGPATGAALMDALDAFRFGEVNKINPESLRQTACHESGHALVNKLLDKTPSFLTIVSRGNYGGFMEHNNDEGKPNYTYGELMNRVCCALAGRAAEILVYGEGSGINTGASSDISHARYYIHAALNDFAMGENLYKKSGSLTGEKLMREQFERATTLLRDNLWALNKLTDLLVSEKSLDQSQLDEFFDGEGIRSPEPETK